jgi:hypothetical protein
MQRASAHTCLNHTADIAISRYGRFESHFWRIPMNTRRRLSRSIVWLMLYTKRLTPKTSRPRLITALSIFFMFGAAMSFIASISLLCPNSFLESMWRLNPRGKLNLSSIGVWAAVLLATVSVCCAAAGIGLWRGARWGHRIAIGLIAVNLVADVTNVILGTEPRAIVGVPVAAGILIYLIRMRV